jgi:hypothetical protein
VIYRLHRFGTNLFCDMRLRECAKGLIHQQNFRVIRQCADDGGTLLHAAGKLTRKVLLKPAQSDLINKVVAALLLRRYAAGKLRD